LNYEEDIIPGILNNGKGQENNSSFIAPHPVPVSIHQNQLFLIEEMN
jgi:hypothetical protein